MSDINDLLQGVLLRLARLEQNTVQMREGVMDGSGTVKLGGAAVAQPATVLSGLAAAGQRVTALKRGNGQPLVLGPHEPPPPEPGVALLAASDISISWGSGTMSFSAEFQKTASISHGLGGTPSFAVCSPAHIGYAGSITTYGSSTITAGLRQVNDLALTVTIDYRWFALRAV